MDALPKDRRVGLIGVGTDHAGLELKDRIVARLRAAGLPVRDYGAHSKEPSDYPDIAVTIGQAVASGEVARGILVCGTGIGMSIAANKVAGVRAALCVSREAALLSRSHNDANVLVLAGRDATAEDPETIALAWLDEPFSGEERHVRRLDKIRRYECGGGAGETEPETP